MDGMVARNHRRRQVFMMRSIHFRPASRHRLLLPALLLLAGCSGRPAVQPVRVVLFIGDGVGVAHWTAALVTTDSLAVGGMPVTGLMDTRADPDLVTDSAAAASALATGRRTRNGRIAMDREGEVLETVVEVAEQAGRPPGWWSPAVSPTLPRPLSSPM